MLLSLERSTSLGSASIFSPDGNLVASVSENEGFRGDAYGLVKGVLEKTGVPVAEITKFAVGTGPGSFSGIRSAIAVLEGLALPLGSKVDGVSSAAAAAHTYRKETPACRDEDIIVVGDARRGRIWMTVIHSDMADSGAGADGFRLIEYGEAEKALPGAGKVISPDWDRLADLLTGIVDPGRLAAYPVFPSSESVARLALAGKSMCPLPIYLSPAVLQA